jgi:hypothetical protein
MGVSWKRTTEAQRRKKREGKMPPDILKKL